MKTTLIFSGGTGRSGTTIVADLLDRHPDVRSSLPIELKFVTNTGGLLDITLGSQFAPQKVQAPIPFYSLRTRRKRRRLDTEKSVKDLALFTEKINNRWWDIDSPPPAGRGLVSGITKEVFNEIFEEFKKNFYRNKKLAASEFLAKVIENQSNNQGEKLWIETTPMNIANAHRLIELIPNARFINMIRDPRDTIASLLTKNWGPNTPLEGIEWFERRITAGHQSLSKIAPNQQITIALEELAVYDRDATYARLLAFLSLDNSPEMAAFFAQSMRPDAASSGRWKEEIKDPAFNPAFEAMIERLNDAGVVHYCNEH